MQGENLEEYICTRFHIYIDVLLAFADSYLPLAETGVQEAAVFALQRGRGVLVVN